MTVSSLISLLLASRTQAHIFHLQTSSFSAHKALEDYYDGIVGMIDGFVESYQGKYDILRGYMQSDKLIEDATVPAMVIYFQNLSNLVVAAGKEIPQDGFLLNQIDEFVAHINATVYKLKHLQ